MEFTKEKLFSEYHELLDLSHELDHTAHAIIDDFNKNSPKLFAVPSHKRIFLFFLTRALKTYSAICLLCKEGYGQDVSTLLRSLLENLISLKYIIHDPSQADNLAARFVGYKWVIFRRHLPEQERSMRSESQEERDRFYARKELILKNVNDFKKKYNIISDKALLTWSGKTVKDMAKMVDEKLMKEYEITFRLCSKFSHPSIISDKEYMISDEESIVFSTLPSFIGVVQNLISAVRYTLEFLSIFNQLYDLKNDEKLRGLEKTFEELCALPKYQSEFISSVESASPKSPISRESKIFFKTK